MNGTELARQLAPILHEQAVQRGHDPWHPYAFAVAEANGNDIDVESVDPSAHLLNGGRAVFLPSDRLILHQNSEDLFTPAFLVAHEIGHALLGDGNGEVDVIDPARAVEPSAVGSERVVEKSVRRASLPTR
ncbi:hypothetical protein [Luteolibacter soli]|uniref:IrrE N-terminal-like domain-containing protein n=1 Tax=Luteolibacter soli TaxID=3135280 RepID=A0ABU9B3G7_9BACT